MEFDKALGAETVLKVEGVEGALKLSCEYQGKDLSAGLFLMTTPDQLVDALAKAIPGDSMVEQGALAALKMGLKAAIG